MIGSLPFCNYQQEDSEDSVKSFSHSRYYVICKSWIIFFWKLSYGWKKCSKIEFGTKLCFSDLDQTSPDVNFAKICMKEVVKLVINGV